MQPYITIIIKEKFSKQQKNTEMGLPKGRTNNKHGRPRGSSNRVTKDLRVEKPVKVST